MKLSCVELKYVEKPIFISNGCLCGEDRDAHLGLDVELQVLPLKLIITQRGEEEEGGWKEKGGRREVASLSALRELLEGRVASPFIAVGWPPFENSFYAESPSRRLKLFCLTLFWWQI